MKEGRYPFGTQHRTVIKYRSDSLCDYDKLGHGMTARIKAIVEPRRWAAGASWLYAAQAAGRTSDEMARGRRIYMCVSAHAFDGSARCQSMTAYW